MRDHSENYDEMIYKDTILSDGCILREYKDGVKFWSKGDFLHRLDGPAAEYPSGKKVWYKEGDLHRLDGPAKEYPDGHVEYWVEGVQWGYLPSEEELLTRDIIG